VIIKSSNIIDAKEQIMKVALIGGTGFVGSYLTEALWNRGHTPRLLVRPGSEGKLPHLEPLERIPGDVSDPKALHSLLEGTDAVIYNIGILREFPHRGISFEELQLNAVKRVAALAQALGVRRFIHMSANAVEQSLTPYQQTKLAAETHLKGLDLDWTIFRPSVIFGDPRGRDEFASMLKRQIVDPPLPIPLFHKGLLPQDAGGFALSPVHVEDVAAAFVGALESPETLHQTYTLGGPQDLTWKQIMRILCEISGKTKPMLPVPAAAPGLAASLLDRFPWFPISRDQIRMLLAGNTCRGDAIFELLDIEPKPFGPAHLGYLRARRHDNRAT
jgi:NADH dehydrogenase